MLNTRKARQDEGFIVLKKTKLAIFNPILLCIAALIGLLVTFDWDFNAYESGTTIFTRLLEPAVIALAFPLYQQFVHVKAKIVPVLIACTVGEHLQLLQQYF